GRSPRHWCFYERRRDDIAANSMRRVISSDRFAETDDCGFGGGISVGGKIFRGRRPTEHAGHVQDGATAALRQELADGGAVGIDEGCEIQINRSAPAVVREF